MLNRISPFTLPGVGRSSGGERQQQQAWGRKLLVGGLRSCGLTRDFGLRGGCCCGRRSSSWGRRGRGLLRGDRSCRSAADMRTIVCKSKESQGEGQSARPARRHVYKCLERACASSDSYLGHSV